MSTGNEFISTLKDLTAGSIGGCAGIVVGHPLDTIKVRLQAQPTPPVYKNALHCFSKTMRLEGPRALFKGLLSPVAMNAPYNALVFGAYGNMSRLLEKSLFPPDPRPEMIGTPHYGKLYLAGAWAGLLSCLICTPMELIKCKMQMTLVTSSSTPVTVEQARHPRFFECIRQIYRTHGPSEFYRGWWPTVWRDMPSYGLFYVAFEWVKNTLGPDPRLVAQGYAQPSVVVLLTAGGAAGVATWLFTYPFDVIKSVQQTLPDTVPESERTMSYIIKSRYNRHGWQFFRRGLGPTLVRAVPVNAVTFLVYSKCLDLMK